jgi:hypothetical protein
LPLDKDGRERPKDKVTIVDPFSLTNWFDHLGALYNECSRLAGGYDNRHLFVASDPELVAKLDKTLITVTMSGQEIKTSLHKLVTAICADRKGVIRRKT